MIDSMKNLPWSIEVKNAYATVYDSKDNPIPFLADIELGWTDTETGPYVDPEGEFALLQFIVDAVNVKDFHV